MGVPVEFCIREKLLSHPVTDMIGYGSHPVPEGFWSDDTSMEIALIDSFNTKGKFDYDDIMLKFNNWVNYGEYTPSGEVFALTWNDIQCRFCDLKESCNKNVKKCSRNKRCCRDTRAF